MFPERQQKPASPPRRIPPHSQRDPFLFGPPSRQRQQPSNIQALIRMFQTPDGEMDIDKIMGTAQQINGLYQQVSPMISKFIKR
ncbi:YppG family protein [Oceanobacillus halophilus]|uniref:YppG-like protein n=1 Tax=Oceanobacillus halophilus TaxID=930130 RepID=A0A494ZUT5_9BACI|nr:YppG family protein [Oceanobacillus halophilus]RKQ29662.1 hypothetical protein D8M06_17170 [Oceanobacillus halophilus]